MNVALGLLVVIGVAAITVTAMLFVRRRAPEGSYFTDGDRASGVFGVLATGFSVLLGFIIFLAFQSYDDARIGAEAEATIVAQQIQTAQFLPADAAKQLTGELVCYGRSVAGAEWDALDAGTLGDAINPWGAEISARSPKSTHRPQPSSRRTTAGWIRRSIESRRATRGSTRRRESFPCLCGWLSL